MQMLLQYTAPCAQVVEMMSQYDQNGDGKMTFAEFAAILCA